MKPIALVPPVLPRTIMPVLAGLLLLFGCQTGTEPITGRPQFILISVQEETRMGLQAWRQLLEQEEISERQNQQEAVRRVGRRIAETVNHDDSGYEWEFMVFSSEQANAFCLPGGKIGVYEGLFRYIESDDELAVVIAHEVAHAVARHGAERMTQAMLVGLGALGISAATRSQEEETRERWLLAYAGLSTLGFILPYSRQHEYAADHLGMIFMARAGYNPEAAITFWQKFDDQEQPLAAITQYLSTHPTGRDRVERMRSILPRAQLEYERAKLRQDN